MTAEPFNVDTLSFGDGTIQTTAAAGGGGGDEQFLPAGPIYLWFY